MDVRVHNISTVKERIHHHRGDYSFVTRCIEVIDSDGVEHSFTIFGKDENELLSSKIERHFHD